jgi:glucose/mannose transport system permease protein
MVRPAFVPGVPAIAATPIFDPEAAWARRRYVLNRIVVYGLLSLFAAIYIVPALIVFLNAFRGPMDVRADGVIGWPRSWGFGAFVRAWTETCVAGTCDGIADNLLNSVRITVPATIISTALGALNGYVLAKWRFRGDTFVFAGIMLGVFMPPQMSLLPWAWIMGQLGLANDVNGLMIIHSVQGIAFATLFCRNFYVSVPDDLVKAARIDGAGFWRIFFKIILPLSTPILIVTVIWQFTSIWNEYLYGMVFTSGDEQPITPALQSGGTGRQSALVLIAALPPLVLYFLGGRYFVRGLTEGALK